MTPETCPKPDLQQHLKALLVDAKQVPEDMKLPIITAAGQVSRPYRDQSLGCGRCQACKESDPEHRPAQR